MKLLITEKTCRMCGETKDINCFGIKTNNKDGRNNACKECIVLDRRAFYERYPEKRNRKTKEQIRATYYRNKLNCNFSSRMRQSLKGRKGGISWVKLVSYTLEELKAHLESQFKEGMTWENYGEWHLDHIRPISSFNIETYECEDFKKCWALENLQPLWAFDNLSKGAKILD